MGVMRGQVNVLVIYNIIFLYIEMIKQIMISLKQCFMKVLNSKKVVYI